MMLRKRRSSKEVSLDEDFQSDDGKLPIEIADWAPNPEDRYQATQLREILRKTLQKLGPGLRIVFVLRDIEGFSLEQTAEALGLSVVAVKARSFRARLQLRERLSRYFKRAEESGEPNPVEVVLAPCVCSDVSRKTSPTVISP
jgi:RNA polymerase sigma-70 factor (ECF subfamily)